MPNLIRNLDEHKNTIIIGDLRGLSAENITPRTCNMQTNS